ncbi:MAG: UvrD-helicase domain-containing protein [Trueperaceae bacterium]
MRVRVASAGTGKTTSLVRRYLELIAAGVPLRRIAGVTFTRSAAGELRQRVGGGIRQLLATGEFHGVEIHGAEFRAGRSDEAARELFEEALRELSGATLTTIHGFMTGALRLAAPAMGLDPDFTVVPEWEAQALFEEELRSLAYLAADPAHPLHTAATAKGNDAPRRLLTLFSKRSLGERFAADADPPAEALVELFDAAYAAFERRLGARMLSPGEIERRSLRLIRIPTAMARLASRFRVILVDEFQDVNPLQGRFFEALEGSGLEVEVVGDPKQSIYGFRNADVGVFRRALEDGEELPPLDRSFRHGELVNRFLNRLTATLAAEGLGFGRREAPAVTAAGKRAEIRGRVEVHWVVDEQPLAALRETEADVLAARLEAIHLEHGVPYGEMAVLARSHGALALAESALTRAGVPAVLLQGRGYFERLEIRDLYNALRAAIEPKGVQFAAWLRGPFGRLSPSELQDVLAASDPEAALARCCPAAAERYRWLRDLVLRPPLEALKGLIREPFDEGRSFVHYLDARQRENVDALLFTVARQPPFDMEVLLGRLELLVRQTDAGDVPQSGNGVKLLTVHAAKGLEWRVTAVFDAGRRQAPNRDSLRVDPDSGLVSLPGSPAFDETGGRLREREESESYRLLYVAASRAREMLLLTGSARGGECHGWARALELMGVGPAAEPRDRPDFVLATHTVAAPKAAGAEPDRPVRRQTEAPEWIDRSFALHPFPPIHSPSRIELAPMPLEPEPLPPGDGEPLPPSDGSEATELPGRATSVGTLVHYAISQSWQPDDAADLENLRAQEVMFPFSPSEQDEVLAEVAELLANYWAMLGRDLPGLAAREQDESELPMALPHRSTVWQGVIDRLYRVNGRWYLDDYKTDRTVAPERYLGQLAVYAEAVRRARGVMPLARLVYLRSRKVVDVGPVELENAFARALAEVF